jgi:hypothetical protein
LDGRRDSRGTPRHDTKGKRRVQGEKRRERGRERGSEGVREGEIERPAERTRESGGALGQETHSPFPSL